LEKAAALGFSIIMNHPFVDGNKRTGHAATETFLILNGVEINASVDANADIGMMLGSGLTGERSRQNSQSQIEKWHNRKR
jgi:death-on-curing protein